MQDVRSQSWRVQAVGVAPDRFESRKALPWRGMRDDELSAETGIPGCVFVHMSGFIGGNKTYEGALEMARAALKCWFNQIIHQWQSCPCYHLFGKHVGASAHIAHVTICLVNVGASAQYGIGPSPRLSLTRNCSWHWEFVFCYPHFTEEVDSSSFFLLWIG